MQEKFLLIAIVQDHLRACGDNHDEDRVLFLSCWTLHTVGKFCLCGPTTSGTWYGSHVEPVPMKWKIGVCDAVVSAFRLQQHLLSPFSTDMHRAAKRGNVRVATRTFAGLEVTSPIDALAFQTDPDFTAMKVSFLTFRGLDIALSSVRLAISPGT